MAKYNYDKKALKGLTPFPFLGEVKTRTAAIEAAPATLPKSVYNPNILAKRLHPAVQHCLIQKVEDHGDAKSFTLVPDAAKGTHAGSGRGKGHQGDGLLPGQSVCLRGAEHRRRAGT